MTIPNSNVSMQDIENEFGGSGSISLNEYYKGGANVPSGVDDPNTIPTQGTISIGDFRGATNAFTYTVSSSTQNLNLRSGAVSAGWDGSSALTVVINSNVYIWSDSTSSPAMTISGSFPGGLSITNNGKIMGKGGKGSGIADQRDGGDAISCSSTCTITNSSSGYIGGGGGGGGFAYKAGTPPRSWSCGGGGGAGGGDGADSVFYSSNGTLIVVAGGGDGGSIGNSGSNADTFRTFLPNGNTQSDIGSPGVGGGAGGGGGNGTTSNSTSSGGGGGGRIFPGTGGATVGGASGGSAGANGQWLHGKWNNFSNIR